MSDNPTDEGRGAEPRPSRRRPKSNGQPLEELLEYLRERRAAGKKTMLRHIAMERFGVSRELFDKANERVKLEMDTPSVRAELVRKFLDDDEVYAILDVDVKTRREKQIRGRARVTHAGLVAEAKALDKEQRDRQNAHTPFEMSVKALQELNKAAQYVHSVGECIDTMPQRDRVIEALGRVDEELSVAFEKALPPQSRNETIDGEAWQTRPMRMLN